MSCLPHLDCLFVNDFEVAALARKAKDHREKTNVDVCMENARLILDRYTMDLVVVHFPHGAVAVHRDGRDASSTSVNVPEKDVIGTNGAGDAFAAGVLYALHEGRDLLEMLRLGHAAAAASIRSLGTTDAVTGWQECLALAEHYGWRADA